MANLSTCILFLAFNLLIVAVIMSSLGGDAIDDHRLRWVSLPMTMRTRCHGSMAECMEEGEFEMQMESEIPRRILATNNYISYKALQRNTVPCSQRGASYYNCKPGAEANPYTRGCPTITRCRST
ncbi:hypothetical protein L6164_034671 [Bauhinia variegata]|uniref:Uncharacterized protein n=1 Tax=Bauhinia variegata TaxID=167791 RepID=A0ACB9KW92_BAUVA|nr:hypothetical protein L6164_034671 [Bauhinia variegata]